MTPLPAHVAHEALPPGSGAAPTLGLGEDGPLGLDLRAGHALVAGPHGSGRTTALQGLAWRAAAAGVRVEAIAATRADGWPHGTGVAAGPAAAAAALRRLAGLADAGGDVPALVLVDDADVLCEDVAVADALARLLRAGRAGLLRVVAAGERRALRRAFGGPLADLRASGRGLLLAADRDVDGDLLGVRLPRGDGGPEPPGRGLLVERGACAEVQVAPGPASTPG